MTRKFIGGRKCTDNNKYLLPIQVIGDYRMEKPEIRKCSSSSFKVSLLYELKQLWTTTNIGVSITI